MSPTMGERRIVWSCLERACISMTPDNGRLVDQRDYSRGKLFSLGSKPLAATGAILRQAR